MIPEAMPLREVYPMKKIIGSFVVVALLIAGAQVLRRHQNKPLVSPAERQTLRDAPQDPNGLTDIHPDKLQLTGAKGMAANDQQSFKPVEWVSIKGGKFTMGTDDGSDLLKDAKPIHEVYIKTFEMSKTLVTVAQYKEYYNTLSGEAKKNATPDTGSDCNWGKMDRDRTKDPINCVDWYQASQYAKFKGARLPTEAEWEYAARSGGKNQIYPWGNEDATSDKAVMNTNSTLPVLSEDGKECARKAGQTQQGLCDMAGNVSEWVQDTYPDPETNQGSYVGAPTNGSAFESVGDYRVMRGGCFYGDAELLRSDYRSYSLSSFRPGIFGFRLARSSR